MSFKVLKQAKKALAFSLMGLALSGCGLFFNDDCSFSKGGCEAPPPTGITDITLSPDKQRIAFVYTHGRYTDPQNKTGFEYRKSAWVVDRGGRNLKELVAKDGTTLESIVEWVPDEDKLLGVITKSSPGYALLSPKTNEYQTLNIPNEPAVFMRQGKVLVNIGPTSNTVAKPVFFDVRSNKASEEPIELLNETSLKDVSLFSVNSLSPDSKLAYATIYSKSAVKEPGLIYTGIGKLDFSQNRFKLTDIVKSFTTSDVISKTNLVYFNYVKGWLLPFQIIFSNLEENQNLASYNINTKEKKITPEFDNGSFTPDLTEEIIYEDRFFAPGHDIYLQKVDSGEKSLVVKREQLPEDIPNPDFTIY